MAAYNQQQTTAYGQPQKPKTPEENEANRCVTSGRLPSSCLGNSLLGGFAQMLSQVLPGATKTPTSGPTMAGVFQGAGNWCLDFIDPSASPAQTALRIAKRFSKQPVPAQRTPLAPTPQEAAPSPALSLAPTN